MRRVLQVLAAAAIISGCRDLSGVRGYWSSHPVEIEDMAAAQDRFAEFAEMAVKAPRKDAFAAIDMLLEKAASDEVTYYIYTDWITSAFSLISSPCFDCGIFLHATEKILSGKIVSPYMAGEVEKSRSICLHNHLGDKALLPEVWQEDGTTVVIPLTQRTLFLVVDQDCPTCRESMGRLLGPEWGDAWHVALCYGHGPLPQEPGWDCFRVSREQSVFDVRQAPFWFTVSADGKIEKTYTSI